MLQRTYGTLHPPSTPPPLPHSRAQIPVTSLRTTHASSFFVGYIAGTDGGLFNRTDIAEKLSWFNETVSPWTDNTNTTLLPTITGVAPAISTPDGAADGKVMAMCFRMCLTNNASNTIAITAPAGYTSASMELLRREIVVSDNDDSSTPIWIASRNQ